jgi:hypothetical protein
MTYLFSDPAAVKSGVALSEALRKQGRMPYSLPAIERGEYHWEGMKAAPRIKIGADVLPWWPARGIYMLLERGVAVADDLVAVPGVGGAWWASNGSRSTSSDTVEPLQVTYCFLDEDPVATAKRLLSTLERRWASGEVIPRLAAPFYPVTGYDWDRYLP